MLKSARVPEREPGYWEYFPKRVTTQLRRAQRSRPTVWWWAVGFATACVVLGFVVGRLYESTSRNGTDSSRRLAETAYNPAEYVRLYREIATMFPNQVRAIVVDEHGVQLVLADKANVPDSPPVLVRACARTGCRSFITFSGQQVRMNGEAWDVLVDGRDEVVVAGRNVGSYRVEGQVL